MTDVSLLSLSIGSGCSRTPSYPYFRLGDSEECSWFVTESHGETGTQRQTSQSSNPHGKRPVGGKGVGVKGRPGQYRNSQGTLETFLSKGETREPLRQKPKPI